MLTNFFILFGVVGGVTRPGYLLFYLRYPLNT